MAPKLLHYRAADGPLEVFMKRAVLWRITMSFLLVGAVTASRADVVDGFNYSTGPLSVVSAGQWRLWGGGGVNDAEVVGVGNPANGVRFDSSYGDVVTYNPQDLFAGGSATFSFDFLVPANSINMGGEVVLGSGDPATNSINYGSGGTITNVSVGYGNNQDGVDIHLWGSGFSTFPLVTVVSADQWHHLSLYALATGSFSIAVDGAPVGEASYSFQPLTDPHGFNSIELYSGHIPGNPAGDGYYLFDNVSLNGTTVPEPATVLMLGSVLAGLAGLRFRRQRR